MRIVHHIISQRRQILAQITKITARQTYANFKTFVFLRSLNVKNSAHEYPRESQLYRTGVSAKYT